MQKQPHYSLISFLWKTSELQISTRLPQHREYRALTGNLRHPARPVLAEELSLRRKRLRIVQASYGYIPELILRSVLFA